VDKANRKKLGTASFSSASLQMCLNLLTLLVGCAVDEINTLNRELVTNCLSWRNIQYNSSLTAFWAD